MINQLLSVIAIVFSFSLAGAQNTLKVEHADMKLQQIVPTKSEFAAEVAKYKALYGEFQKREDVVMDPALVGLWTSSAMKIENGMNANGDKTKQAVLVENYFTLKAVNQSAERTISDTDRILVLECCHKVKEGKICDSLNEDRKKDVKKCQKGH